MDLICHLWAFNRKERFFLVGAALGNPDFRLCDEFRSRLGAALRMSVPPDAFCAMDYHLDWLYASVRLAGGASREGIHHNGDGGIRGNQEDIDLMVAFADSGGTHLICIEAKGVGAWSNSQMLSKADRLRLIFGDDGRRCHGIVPYFVLASPSPPKLLVTAGWPAWMTREGKLRWIPLRLPSGLRKVTRCDDAGVPSASGQFWRVVRKHRVTSAGCPG